MTGVAPAPAEDSAAGTAASGTEEDGRRKQEGQDDQEHPRSPRRRVRSFVTRAGRVSVAQERALTTLMPQWGLPYRAALLDFSEVFGRSAPTVLEIGFGMGETTARLAAARPDVNFLGIEVHTPGVGALLKQIDEAHLTNLRLIQHDAVEVLEDMIPEGSLAGVHIFFPDPWPKKRHHKRRLIAPALVRLLSARLCPGGYIHSATDWEDYALQMREVLEGEPSLSSIQDPLSSRTNPLVTRPATKFEERGLKLGHVVFDFVYARPGHDAVQRR